VWENNIEGTRQIDSVTSGERVPYISYNIVFDYIRIRNTKMRWHRSEGSDCLLKTQDSAKL